MTDQNKNPEKLEQSQQKPQKSIFQTLYNNLDTPESAALSDAMKEKIKNFKDGDII